MTATTKITRILFALSVLVLALTVLAALQVEGSDMSGLLDTEQAVATISQAKALQKFINPPYHHLSPVFRRSFLRRLTV